MIVHRTQFLRRRASLSHVDPSSSWMSLSMRQLQIQQEHEQQQQVQRQQNPDDDDSASAQATQKSNPHHRRNGNANDHDGNNGNSNGNNSYANAYRSAPSSPSRSMFPLPSSAAAPLDAALLSSPTPSIVERQKLLWNSRSIQASTLALATSSPPQSPSNREGRRSLLQKASSTNVLPNQKPLWDPSSPESPALSVRDRRQTFERLSSVSSSIGPPLEIAEPPPRNPYLSLRRSSLNTNNNSTANAAQPPATSLLGSTTTTTTSTPKDDAILLSSPSSSSVSTSLSIVSNSNNDNNKNNNESTKSIQIDGLPLTNDSNSTNKDEDDDMCNSGEFSIATNPTDDENEKAQKLLHDSMIMKGLDTHIMNDDITCNTNPNTIDYEALDAIVPSTTTTKQSTTATNDKVIVQQSSKEQDERYDPPPPQQQPQQDDDQYSFSSNSNSFDEWTLHLDREFDTISFSSISSGSYREPTTRQHTSYRIRYDGPTTLNLDRFAASEDRFANNASSSHHNMMSTTGTTTSGQQQHTTTNDAAPSQPSRRSNTNANTTPDETAYTSYHSKRTCQTRPDVWITPKTSPFRANDVADANDFNDIKLNDMTQLSWRVQRVWKDLSPDMVQSLPRRTRDPNSRHERTTLPTSSEQQETTSSNNNNDEKDATNETKYVDTQHPSSIIEYDDDEDSSVKGDELFERIRTLVGAPTSRNNNNNVSCQSTIHTSSTWDESHSNRDDAPPKLPQRNWKMEKFYDENDGNWHSDSDSKQESFNDNEFIQNVTNIHVMENKLLLREIRHTKQLQEKMKKYHVSKTPTQIPNDIIISSNVSLESSVPPPVAQQHTEYIMDMEIPLKGDDDDATSNHTDDDHDDNKTNGTNDRVDDRKHHRSKSRKKQQQQHARSLSPKTPKKSKKSHKKKSKKHGGSSSSHRHKSPDSGSHNDDTPTKKSPKKILSPREVNLRFGGANITDSDDSSSGHEEEQRPKQRFKKKKRKKKIAPRNENLVCPADVNRRARLSSSDDDDNPKKPTSRRMLLEKAKSSRKIKRLTLLGESEHHSGDDVKPRPSPSRPTKSGGGGKQRAKSKSMTN